MALILRGSRAEPKSWVIEHAGESMRITIVARSAGGSNHNPIALIEAPHSFAVRPVQPAGLAQLTRTAVGGSGAAGT